MRALLIALVLGGLALWPFVVLRRPWAVRIWERFRLLIVIYAIVIAAAAGGWDIGRGISEGDGYRIADGAINVGLAIAGALTLATPVGWGLLAVGALWSVGSYLSGDVPLTRRIRDAAGRMAERAPAAARETLSVTVTGPPQIVPRP